MKRIKDDCVKFNENIGKIIALSLVKYDNDLKCQSQFTKMLKSSKDLIDILLKCREIANGTIMPQHEAEAMSHELEQLVSNKEEFPELGFLQKLIEGAIAWNRTVISILNTENFTEELISGFYEGNAKLVSQKLASIQEIMKARIEKTQAGQLLENAKKMLVCPDEGITALQAEIQKSKTWEDEWLNLKSNITSEICRRMLSRVLMIKIRAEGDLSVVGYIEESAKWSDCIDKLCDEGIYIDFNTLSQSINKATIKDFEYVLTQSALSKMVPAEKSLKLKNLKQNLDKWLKSYELQYSRVWSIPELREFSKQGLELKISIPELDSINERLQVLEMLEVLKKPDTRVPLDSAQEILDKSRKNNFPVEIIIPLNDMLLQAKEYVSQIIKYSQDTNNVYSNIPQIAELLQKVKDSHIILPDVTILRKMVQSYEWYQKAILKTKNDFTNVTPDFENSLKFLLGDAYQIQPLFGEAVNLRLKIQRVLWGLKIKSMLQNNKFITEPEFYELYDEMKKCELNENTPELGEYYKIVRDTYETYNFVKNEYEQITLIPLDEISWNQVEQLKNKLKIAKQKSETQKIKFGQFDEKLDKYINIIFALSDLVKILESKEKTEFELFAVILSKVLFLLSSPTKQCKDAKEEITKYKEWMSKYNEYKNAKKSNLIKSQISKISELKLLIENSRQIVHISLCGKIEEIQKDIEIRENLEKKAQEILGDIEKTGKINMPDEIESLIQKFTEISLYDENIMHGLRISKWLLKSKTMWDSKKYILEDWNNLLSERHFLLSPDSPYSALRRLLQTPEIDNIIDQIRESSQISKEISDLLDSKNYQKQTVSLVNSLLDKIKKLHINFDKEIKQLEGILEEAQKFEKLIQALKSEKSALCEYEKLRTQIINAKILLPHLEGEVVRILNSAKIFDKRVENARLDATHRKARISHRVAEDILKEYLRLPFKTHEGETLQTNLQSSISHIEEVKAKINNLRFNKSPSLEEVLQLTEDAGKLPIDMGSDEVKLSAEIWRIKYDVLITRHEQLEYKPYFSALKGLLADADQIKEFNEHADKEKLRKLQEIAFEAKKDISKIFSICDRSELEELEKSLSNKYIDYTEFIIEQRTKIDLNQVSPYTSRKRNSPEKSTHSHNEHSPASKYKKPKERIHIPVYPETHSHAKTDYKKFTESHPYPKKHESPSKIPEKKISKISNDARERFKNELMNLLNKLPNVSSSEKSTKLLAFNMEFDLYKTYESIVDYAAATAKICRAVEQLRNYPLVCKQLIQGSINLPQLCRTQHAQTMEKIKSLEDELQKKETHVSKVESLLKEMDDLDKNKEKSVDYSALIPQAPSLKDLQAEWEKASDSDSLESFEIEGEAQKENRVFSDDDEMPIINAIPEDTKLVEPNLLMTPENLKKTNEIIGGTPYDPMAVDQRDEENKTLKHKSKIKPSKLAPPQFDPVNPENLLPHAKLIDLNSISQLKCSPKSYKIWSGNLEYAKLRIPCSMYTNEDLTIYSKIPALSQRLAIDGRGKIEEITEFLNNKRDKPNCAILKGWVCPDISYPLQSVDKYVQELQNAGRCGVIDIKEIDIYIYLMPYNTQNSDFIKSWKIDPDCEKSSVKLAYFIAINNLTRLENYFRNQEAAIYSIGKPDEPKFISEQNLNKEKMLTEERTKINYEKGEEYMRKVLKLQDFVEKNKSEFTNFMRVLPSSKEQKAEICFPPMETK